MTLQKIKQCSKSTCKESKLEPRKRKDVKQEIPKEKQNKGQVKCKNVPAARQNQNKDINISISI